MYSDPSGGLHRQDVVSDGGLSYAAGHGDTVLISPLIRLPWRPPAAPQSAFVGKVVTMDGQASSGTSMRLRCTKVVGIDCQCSDRQKCRNSKGDSGCSRRSRRTCRETYLIQLEVDDG